MTTDLNKKELLSKALRQALIKIKLSLIVNGEKLIPATLCLGDLGEDLFAVFSTECLVIGDTAKITLSKTDGLVLIGKVVGVKKIQQYVIKPKNAELFRIYLKFDHFNKREINIVRISQFKNKF